MQCLVAIFPILHLDRISALIYARACRQLAVVIEICVDCTAINNQVNNIHSMQSGPCIQWGRGRGECISTAIIHVYKCSGVPLTPAMVVLWLLCDLTVPHIVSGSSNCGAGTNVGPYSGCWLNVL